MRLVCLHADTVDALKRLNIRVDDLTPKGLWFSEYHLIGLTSDQLDALAVFHIEAEDITPAQLAGMAGQVKENAPDTSALTTSPADLAGGAQSAAAPAGGLRPTAGDRPETPAAGADEAGREPARVGSDEAEVPLAQSRDASLRAVDGEPKPNGKAGQPTAQGSASQAVASQPLSGQQQSAQKGPKGGTQPVPQAQGRKGQQGQTQGAQPGGQRYGTTRLRISVAGKYTEATVAQGKIVVAGRSFDSPDQAAAELTKSRGDWTFWEYYDSTDGKWRMLTRDWDSVLKSATPGGR